MSPLEVWEWLLLRDYERTRRRALADVIKRYSRGNVSVQNGSVLDDVALAELRSLGDRSIAELIAQERASRADRECGAVR